MHSAEEIKCAKAQALVTDERHHEHDDCIRMAYEWLDAQAKTTHPVKSQRQWKHQIEKWCGRYVSQADVEVAASMHPDISGEYPFYNISMRLTLPSERMLDHIGEAGKHAESYPISRSPHEYVIEESSWSL